MARVYTVSIPIRVSGAIENRQIMSRINMKMCPSTEGVSEDIYRTFKLGRGEGSKAYILKHTCTLASQVKKRLDLNLNEVFKVFL